MPLSKDQFKALAHKQLQEVTVPDWPDTVFVQSINVAQKQVLAEHLQNGDRHKFFSLLLQMSLVDPDGNQLFTETEASDLLYLDDKPVLFLVNHLLTMNKLRPEDHEAQKKSLEPTA